MFGITVHLLTGRYAAAEHNDREQAEWPPHPARLFSSLVDAWAAGGKQPDEADALRWLERQPAPAIAASEEHRRTVPVNFVPVNDAIVVGSHLDQEKLHLLWEHREQVRAEGDARSLARAEKDLAKQLDRLKRNAAEVPNQANQQDEAGAEVRLMPDYRVKQPRHFPVVIPDEPAVSFIWDQAPSTAHRDALDRVAARVARLGHSSSLASVVLTDQPGEADWVPDPVGELMLRVARPGQLQDLEEAFERHQGVEPRVLPARSQPYTRPRPHQDDPVVGEHSGEWLVFRREEGPAFPSVCAVDLGTALRGALLSHCQDPIPELLSGHDPSGAPSRRPHIAFLSLPFVGAPHSTGHLMGLAMVLPPTTTAAERQAILAALGRWRRQQQGMTLTLGRAGAWKVSYEPLEAEAKALRPGTWTRRARDWATVTPVALDRNPGDLYSARAEAAREAEDRAREEIVRACLRTGLPRPSSVSIGFAPRVKGTVPATEFPPFPPRRGPGRFRRVLVHAAISFPQPIRGPVLLGAGRFLGLGLFRPLADGNDE